MHISIRNSPQLKGELISNVRTRKESENEDNFVVFNNRMGYQHFVSSKKNPET